MDFNSSLISPRRIEETWRLWCKFLDDYSRFEDWLKMAERTAANPNSGDVLYTVAKEELKKFEVSCEAGGEITCIIDSFVLLACFVSSIKCVTELFLTFKTFKSQKKNSC